MFGFLLKKRWIETVARSLFQSKEFSEVQDGFAEAGTKLPANEDERNSLHQL